MVYGNVCQSCNGVIGRDCFNPEECMAITQDQAARYREQSQESCQLEQCESALIQCCGEIQSLNERIEAMSQTVAITNPVAMLVLAGWKFSAYQSPGTWQVWAKHPLGGACMVAELTRIGRTGFDVKATAEAIAEFLNWKKETSVADTSASDIRTQLESAAEYHRNKDTILTALLRSSSEVIRTLRLLCFEKDIEAEQFNEMLAGMKEGVGIRIADLESKNEQLTSALRDMVREFEGDSGTGVSYWADKPVYRAAKKALGEAVEGCEGRMNSVDKRN